MTSTSSGSGTYLYESGLVDRIGKLETALGERIARLEVATEGFIKPQSTTQ